LPGLEASLSAAAGLWRIGRYHFDAQFLHRTSDLSPLPTIYRLASLWSEEEVPGTITVERAENTLMLDDMA
jgi:hypothetical protein